MCFSIQATSLPCPTMSKLLVKIEAFKALKEFAAAKTPGTDGLTTEYLKYFWPELKALIVGIFNIIMLLQAAPCRYRSEEE